MTSLVHGRLSGMYRFVPPWRERVPYFRVTAMARSVPVPALVLHGTAGPPWVAAELRRFCAPA